MNNKYTPGFYQLELLRTKQQYEFSRIRLIYEQKKLLQHSESAENNYINSIEDYLLAIQNQNSIKSEEASLAYEIAYKDTQQKRQNIFQKLHKIFR